jgi:hypothetical protein
LRLGPDLFSEMSIQMQSRGKRKKKKEKEGKRYILAGYV